MPGGKVVGGNDNGVLEEWIWLVRNCQSIPLGAGGENDIGDGIELFHQFCPLAEQVAVGNSQQDAPPPQPLLGDNQHGLVALA